MGEYRGSGLALGYLFIQAKTKNPPPHSKQVIISQFLKHFRDKWKLSPIITLSDKDWSEINACRDIFPDAKHQLCFWHVLRAIRQRLALTRRQPSRYDGQAAHEAFDFIDPDFVPFFQLGELPQKQVIILFTPHVKSISNPIDFNLS